MAIIKSHGGRALACILVLTTLSGCTQPRKVTPAPLPERDIVFQMETSRYGDCREVGFVNGDGTGATTIELSGDTAPIVLEPSWTSDGAFLVLGGQMMSDYALMAITSAGELRRYNGGLASNAAPVTGQHSVVIAGGLPTGMLIGQFDLDKGRLVRTYVQETNGHLDVGTNALYGPWLVYSRWAAGRTEDDIVSEIVLLDVETGEKRVLVHVEGWAGRSLMSDPALSPDGRAIAYTATDGIYLIRLEGGDARRAELPQLIRRYSRSSYGPSAPVWDEWPPVVSWSPDSRWLVYHRCLLAWLEDCSLRRGDYGIFKLNVETGREELLVRGGLNPYWRLSPVDEPGS